MRISDWSSDVCSSDLHDPLQIAEHVVVGTFGLEDLADVHRMLAAQRREARMHLRGHRSRHRARGIVGGPECVAAGLRREIFDDRQAVHHHDRKRVVLWKMVTVSGILEGTRYSKKKKT